MSLSAYFGSLSVANLLSRMPAAAAQGMIWGLMALGVDRETAEADACKMEHDISQTSFEAICRHARDHL